MFRLSSDELDAVSAILGDYVALMSAHIAQLERMSNGRAFAAIGLLDDWRTRAEDIRQRIEARD